MTWFYDYWGVLLLLPALLLALGVQLHLKITYGKYNKVTSVTGMTGYDAARKILDGAGLYQVPIECIQGELTDHFDPSANVLRLSQGVYGSGSVAAIGIAAHECGHAIQYAEQYGPMKLRGALVKTTNVSSSLSMAVVFLGLLLGVPTLAYVGAALFAVVVFFQLVTLPVEFDASGRALRILAGMVPEEERRSARKVLTAAALTYVAALVSSLMQLLRLILIIRGGRGRK